LNRIRRLPGITLRSGVPVFTKSSAEINAGGSFEPLYVLNGYPVGNSFRDVDQLVDNVNVEKIEVMSAAESSFYGSRGSNGVILITTQQ
jgi:TonB-dependent SusC/RagA subfamily outer membrane receptor